MKVTLSFYDLEDAVKLHMQEKYGLDNVEIDYDCSGFDLEVREFERVYKRHKNGKVKKDKDGCWVLDKEKSKWVTKYFSFGESDDFSFYIQEQQS